ncbi:MAG: glycine/sarcosine/betaine reductase selenoprotein B family protein [Gammaproteobacteria bacterium]|nr:glycine/sarcosine/betaine reductase selenoprotein B family protein [Gammaproteobacteria bacterium]
MSSPPIDYIEQTRQRYESLGYTPYEWARIEEPPPFAPLRRPLGEARVGLIASGGIYREGQIAFHYRDDVSFREIPADVAPEALRVTHFAYDQTDARTDPNVVFPIEALREAAASGRIGEVSANAYTFMGGIYSQRRVREVLAPALADRVQADGVDAVVLVPV